MDCSRNLLDAFKIFEIFDKNLQSRSIHEPPLDNIIVNLFLRNYDNPQRNIYEYLVIRANMCYNNNIQKNIDTNFIMDILDYAEEGLKFTNSLLEEDDDLIKNQSKFDTLLDKLDNDSEFLNEIAYKYPKMNFKKLAFALFKKIDRIIQPIYNTCVGIGIMGMNVKNDYGTLYIISETGGNETSTDYNAVFIRHAKIY